MVWELLLWDIALCM